MVVGKRNKVKRVRKQCRHKPMCQEEWRQEVLQHCKTGQRSISSVGHAMLDLQRWLLVTMLTALVMKLNTYYKIDIVQTSMHVSSSSKT